MRQKDLETPEILVDACFDEKLPQRELKGFLTSSIRNVLGMDQEVDEFYRIAGRDKMLKHLAEKFRGVRPPRFPSIFESLVNACACQQISLDVCILLLNRLASRFALSSRQGDDTLFAFPTPSDFGGVEASSLRALGFSTRKAATTLEITRQILSGLLDIRRIVYKGNEDVMRILQEIKGIGLWSSQYVLLRGLGRLEIFPAADSGAQAKLQRLLGLSDRPGIEETKRIVDRWAPFAGFVYFHLLLDSLSKKGLL